MHDGAHHFDGRRRLLSVKRSHILAAAAVVAGLGAATVAPAALFPDAAAPSTISAYVGSARANLASNLNDFEIRPFHLRFLRADCRAQGGAVLWFEQRMFPYMQVEYAYTLTGDWPPQGWSGGAHLEETNDEEVAAFLGGSPVPCE